MNGENYWFIVLSFREEVNCVFLSDVAVLQLWFNFGSFLVAPMESFSWNLWWLVFKLFKHVEMNSIFPAVKITITFSKHGSSSAGVDASK